MATIRKRTGKYGTTYRAELCVKGERRSATFDTASAAHAWAEETERLLRAGDAPPGEAPLGDMTLADAIAKYLAASARRKKPNTVRMDNEIAARLLRAFAGRTLRQIDGRDVAAYRDRRLQSVGPSSVIQDMSFLRCLYRMARVDWGLDAGDPTAEVRRPSAPRHRLALLTPEEIARLLDACGRSRQVMLRNYVLLLLHTAMRPAEAANLRWEQVLFDQGMIDLTETKTDPRRVPMTATVASMLTEMDAARREDEAARRAAEGAAFEANPHVFLPPGRADRALAGWYFRHSFETACRAAGVPDFTLYGLRHSAASYLVMRGVDIRTVAEIMGHRNISQTMRYTHFLDEHKKSAIAALDGIGG